jgi:hypothetical protein
MTRRVRSIYDWQHGNLEHIGWISEARLRAWEYRAEGEAGWEFASGQFRDTVRSWKSARPDLAPDTLLIGDHERREM